MSNTLNNLENILEINEITLSGCGTKRTQQTSIVIFKKESTEKAEEENNNILAEEKLEKSA